MNLTHIYCEELNKNRVFKLLSILVATLQKRCNSHRVISYIGFLILLFILPFYPLHGQTTDLTAQIKGTDMVRGGQVVEYEISFANNGPSAVHNALFVTQFPENAQNLKLLECDGLNSSECPKSDNISLNKNYFNGVIPFLPVNGRVTFIVSLTCPSPVENSSFSAMAQIIPPMNVVDIDKRTNTSIWNSSVINNTDIEVVSFTHTPTGAGCNDLSKEYDFTVKWVNHGPADAYRILLTNALKRNNEISSSGNSRYIYNYSISRLEWKTGKNSSIDNKDFSQMEGSFTQAGKMNFNNVISSLSATAFKFAAGDTITLNFSFKIMDVTIEGCESNINWTLRNEAEFSIPQTVYLKDTVQSNNKSISDIIGFTCETSCSYVDVAVSATVNHTEGAACEDMPESYIYHIKWINKSSVPITGIELVNNVKHNNNARGTGHTTYTYDYEISDISWSSKLESTFEKNTISKTKGSFTKAKSSNFSRLSTLTSVVSEFLPGDTIELSFTLNLDFLAKAGCGRNVEWTLRNEAFLHIPASSMLLDTTTINNLDIIDIHNFHCSSIACKETDIKVESIVSSDQGVSCNDFPKTYNFEVRWINNGPSDADGIILSNTMSRNNIVFGTEDVTYSYKFNISNIVWNTDSESKLPTGKFSRTKGEIVQRKARSKFEIFSKLNSSPLPSFKSGDTISLRYSFTIEDLNIKGCGNRIEWDIKNEALFKIPTTLSLQDTDTADNNMNTLFISHNRASSTDLSISKKISQQIANTDDVVQVTIIFQNASRVATIPATWVDTIPQSMEIIPGSIQCKSLFGTSACASVHYDPVQKVLSQTIPILEGNSALEITYLGKITALYSLTESSKVHAISPCLDCVPETNLSQTNYQINGSCDKWLAGKDVDTTLCSAYHSQIELSELLKNDAYQTGVWSRISGSGGVFNAARGVFASEPEVTTTTFRYIVPSNAPCKEDTSYVRLKFVCPNDDLRIRATPKFNAIVVEWTKESETNLDYFEIYRSEDGLNFYKIGSLDARGNSHEKYTYSYPDQNIMPNITYYYQVRQMDFYGFEIESNIVQAKIEFGDFMVSNIYPNPTDYWFNVSIYSTYETDVQFSIRSTLGQVVYTQFIRIEGGNTTITIDHLGNLAQGGYYFTVDSKVGSNTQALVIARE